MAVPAAMALADCNCARGRGPRRDRGPHDAHGTSRTTWASSVAVVLCVAVTATSAASPQRAISAVPSANAVGTLAFLRRFGYLEGGEAGAAPAGPDALEAAGAPGISVGDRFGADSAMGRPDSETLYTEEAVVDAIKLVQKYGALPQTGVLDEATEQLMKARRCGCPDVVRDDFGHDLGHGGRSKRFIVASKGWKKRHLKYHIANWSPKVGKEAVHEQVVRAFDAWSRYGRLRFSKVDSPGDADITVAFGRGSHGDWFPFDGQGGILAHAFYPYEMAAYGGDIHFDDDELWAANPNVTQLQNGAVDLFLVAVHELGHSLGLGHSPDPGSIMFPYYQTKAESFALGHDDILGMYELYIKRQLEEDNDTGQAGWSGEERPAVTPRPTRTTPARRPRPPPRPRPTSTTTTTPRPTTGAPTRAPTRAPTYAGDDETVEEHKKHDDKHRIPPSPTGPEARPGHHATSEASGEASVVPDLCAGHYDAVAQLRRELFVFKGQYLWRLRERGTVMRGYPAPLRVMFRDLPEYATSVDAAYQRDDGNIVLFSGPRYWVYDGERFVEDSPQHVSRYGLPGDTARVDAVMVWAKNRATYFFRGSEFWRYNSTASRMDPGYPKPISRSWTDVPDDIDDAMTWTDGETYFFKGESYYQIDNKRVKVVQVKNAPKFWFGCS